MLARFCPMYRHFTKFTSLSVMMTFKHAIVALSSQSAADLRLRPCCRPR